MCPGAGEGNFMADFKFDSPGRKQGSIGRLMGPLRRSSGDRQLASGFEDCVVEMLEKLRTLFIRH